MNIYCNVEVKKLFIWPEMGEMKNWAGERDGLLVCYVAI